MKELMRNIGKAIEDVISNTFVVEYNPKYSKTELDIRIYDIDLGTAVDLKDGLDAQEFVKNNILYGYIALPDAQLIENTDSGIPYISIVYVLCEELVLMEFGHALLLNDIFINENGEIDEINRY